MYGVLMSNYEINNNLESDKWETSITKVEPNKLTTRGFLQTDLIDNISFSDMVYLLLMGKLPIEKHSKMLNAIIVSFCDHGITPPSTHSARLIASSGSSLNSAVAGGLLAFGKNHSGALELAMDFFQCVIYSNFKDLFSSQNLQFNQPKVNSDYLIKHNEKIENLSFGIVEENLKNNKKIPGFGHRYHSKDPRAFKIIKLAKKYDCASIHTELALNIEKNLYEEKKININIDGACAAILSDMGFDSNLGTGLFMIGRLPGLVAHTHEEMSTQKGFRKFCNLDDVIYKDK